MSQQKPLRGVLAAVPTPFTADASGIDTKTMKTIADSLHKNGVHGIVCTGTTGEFVTMSIEEHKHVVKSWVEAVAGRMSVVAGTGALSTKAAVELSAYADSVGADAVMVVPPFYDPVPFEGLVNHYKQVSDAIKIPIMYYNVPSATNVALSADELRELANRVPNLRYMKDTSNNAKDQVDLLTNTPSNLQISNGWDTMTFSALALGDPVVVVGAASVVPRECVELYEALVVNADLKKGRELWKYLWKVLDFLEGVNYQAGIKAGLKIRGIDAGPVREPTLPLSAEDQAKFEKILSPLKPLV
ncbi:unnamed protein product [Sympodiomycopsis kandeliae]